MYKQINSWQQMEKNLWDKHKRPIAVFMHRMMIYFINFDIV